MAYNWKRSLNFVSIETHLGRVLKQDPPECIKIQFTPKSIWAQIFYKPKDPPYTQFSKSFRYTPLPGFFLPQWIYIWVKNTGGGIKKVLGLYTERGFYMLDF